MSHARGAARASPSWTWPRLRNPVFTRELLTTLRQPRGFALLALSLLVTAVIVLRAWPDQPEGIVGQGELSRTIFGLFSSAQMLVLAFVVPGTLAASMTSEKERETLDLLLTTPLSGDMIVVGKLLAGLSYFLLLALAALPVMMLCAVIGGLSGEAVLRLFVVLGLQGLAYGLTCICCSAGSRRTAVAVMLSYLFVAFEATLFFPAADDLRATILRAVPLTLALYLVARRAVRRPHDPAPPPSEEEPGLNASVLVLRPDAFPDMLLLPRPRRGELPDGVNPIVVKEQQAGLTGAGLRFVRVLIQAGMVLGLVVFLWALTQSANVAQGELTTPSHVFLCFVAAFAMTLGPAIGARAFSGEREEGTAEMLCLALLPRRRIVLGKFVAGVRVVATLTAINSVAFVGYAAVTLSWFQLAQLGALLLSISALSLAVGMRCSLGAPTTISALLQTYVALFLVWVAPALLAVFLGRPGGWGDAALRALTPFLASDVSFSARRGLPVLELACLAAHLTLNGLATVALLVSCARGFDRHMRAAAGR